VERRVPDVGLVVCSDGAGVIGRAEQIAFKNLARAALDQLAGADKNDLAAVEEALTDLGEDDFFWRRQARTLAVFATRPGCAPSGCRTG
jgi:hypothetical protein